MNKPDYRAKKREDNTSKLILANVGDGLVLIVGNTRTLKVLLPPYLNELGRCLFNLVVKQSAIQKLYLS